MKKLSLEILYRHRTHLLEKEQIVLQDKIAEESQQKIRLLQLQARIQATHNAKARAGSVEEIRSLDEAAAYLHSRVTLAKRAVALSSQAREAALERTLKSKQSRDQVGLMMEKARVQRRRDDDEAEKRQIDELVTSRYAMALGGL
jgi:flagellar biosynthesis chaperone FliJ